MIVFFDCCYSKLNAFYKTVYSYIGAFLVAQWLIIHLQCRSHRKHRFSPWVKKIHWRRAWQHTPVLSPEEYHGQRSLAGYSPSGLTESDNHWIDLAHMQVRLPKGHLQMEQKEIPKSKLELFKEHGWMAGWGSEGLVGSCWVSAWLKLLSEAIVH